ncbi:gluconate 2-dehydrogenase subunit 3 family protein [Paenibacillus sp. FJAT-26967]|uniref:gluconate 2-dehydrogenase subunit 3 family protein n=1 Tax=Paenibacillus sp. FJAT-26967 TaxID=1729690 RepID=UPI000838D8A2|nr:gluconate 2-dehydrogenase subunit 3 family protein [Paenibacillus sp. FJAT-26967]
MAENQTKPPKDASRRNFLKVSGAALGGLVAGGVIGGIVGSSMNGATKPEQAAPETQPAGNAKDYNQAPMFFNQEQLRITEAAAERIFPKDELGPGAKELGVAYYIDHQMAGQWGLNAKDYMMGPFYKAEVTQGYQDSYKRNELFVMGLQVLNDHSSKKYQKAFADLAANEQDEVLTAFEKGKEVQLNGVPSSTFFEMLRTLTIEGVYSDPLYGGNKNMGGWKMRKYPGDQMSYMTIIDKNEFVTMEPLSLHDHLKHS